MQAQTSSCTRNSRIGSLIWQKPAPRRTPRGIIADHELVRKTPPVSLGRVSVSRILAGICELIYISTNLGWGKGQRRWPWIARHSWVNSSMTLSMRYLQPSWVRSSYVEETPEMILVKDEFFKLSELFFGDLCDACQSFRRAGADDSGVDASRRVRAHRPPSRNFFKFLKSLSRNFYETLAPLEVIERVRFSKKEKLRE